MWTAQYCKFEKPRTFLSSGGLGTMGYGMGAAIGACIGTGRKTVLVTGDGCFHMNLNEMSTAVKEKLPLVILLMDNRVLGMVRQWQTLFYGKRYSQTMLDTNTDFVKLAEAFGAKGMTIAGEADILPVLTEAFKAADGGPVLVDCKIGHGRQGAAHDRAGEILRRYYDKILRRTAPAKRCNEGNFHGKNIRSRRLSPIRAVCSPAFRGCSRAAGSISRACASARRRIRTSRA